MKHGEGEETRYDEDGMPIFYKGSFREGLKHGSGIERCPSYTFDGEWKSNLMWSGEYRRHNYEEEDDIIILEDGN